MAPSEHLTGSHLINPLPFLPSILFRGTGQTILTLCWHLLWCPITFPSDLIQEVTGEFYAVPSRWHQMAPTETEYNISFLYFFWKLKETSPWPRCQGGLLTHRPCCTLSSLAPAGWAWLILSVSYPRWIPNGNSRGPSHGLLALTHILESSSLLNELSC